MPSDVKLESIEFGSVSDNTSAIDSIKVNLTHGFSSKVIKREGALILHHKKINVEAEKPIKLVKVAKSSFPGLPPLWIKFMDKHGSLVAIYDKLGRINHIDG